MVSDYRILDLFIAVVSLYNYNFTSLFITQFTCHNEPIILGFFPPTSWGSNKPIKAPLLSMIFLSDTTENKLNLKSQFCIPFKLSNSKQKPEPFKFFNTF